MEDSALEYLRELQATGRVPSKNRELKSRAGVFSAPSLQRAASWCCLNESVASSFDGDGNEVEEAGEVRLNPGPAPLQLAPLTTQQLRGRRDAFRQAAAESGSSSRARSQNGSVSVPHGWPPAFLNAPWPAVVHARSQRTTVVMARATSLAGVTRSVPYAEAQVVAPPSAADSRGSSVRRSVITQPALSVSGRSVMAQLPGGSPVLSASPAATAVLTLSALQAQAASASARFGFRHSVVVNAPLTARPARSSYIQVIAASPVMASVVAAPRASSVQTHRPMIRTDSSTSLQPQTPRGNQAPASTRLSRTDSYVPALQAFTGAASPRMAATPRTAPARVAHAAPDTPGSTSDGSRPTALVALAWPANAGSSPSYPSQEWKTAASSFSSPAAAAAGGA
eukprot:CAMPEP_0115061244 /NCGR_PEP_ID=MMETSP0227-20121206/7900_1 /TAXON_ID=89957 /ORGANISM="Polarella glacialis, Strain CCMP 1383" /LENGTH=395 /DNA_ID=CAMNT_0002446525 /DNA_START=55 /DNA_END=1242 /DNA_ORIENTATION=-